jgi:hypothetical protein
MNKNQNSQDRIGEFLVKIGAMTKEQRDQVLKLQAQEPDKMFGKIAVEHGFINDMAIDTFLGQRPF